MNAHYGFSENSYKARLVIGWTVAIAGVLLVGFHLPTGTILMTIGVCVIFPTYYARIQNEQIATRTEPPQRSTLPSPKEETKKEQALEYRDLFHEGVISFEEYHDAVAQLYPELNRRQLVNKDNAQQGVGDAG